MRTLLAAALVGLLLMPSTVTASATYNESLPATTTVIAAPLPASTPVFSSTRQYNVNLFAGDSISATVTWADASNGAAVANDIDITLSVPSMAPVPIPALPPATADPVVAFALAAGAQRVARATCTDTVAKSQNHPVLGGANGVESVSFTVPANGEQGAYALLVRGFFLSAAQPYSMSLTVTTSGGVDVTASRVVTGVGGAPSALSTLIVTNPHCALL